MPEIAEQAHAAMRAIEDRYGVNNVGPQTLHRTAMQS